MGNGLVFDAGAISLPAFPLLPGHRFYRPGQAEKVDCYSPGHTIAPVELPGINAK